MPIGLNAKVLLRVLGLILSTQVLTATIVFAQASPETLSGTVVDATTNEPIDRALVRLTGQSTTRALLTDASGRFSFIEVDPTQIMLTALKPGYHLSRSSSDPTHIQVKPEDAGRPLQIRLYPEALLTGTIIDPDGNPLPHIQVEALRATEDDLGRPWIIDAVTSTNAHGQFRMPVVAGDYRVQTDLAGEAGDFAVMPTSLPDSGEASIHLLPGQQRDLDIRPVLASLLAVSARTEMPIDQIGELIGILPDGTSFPIPFTPTGATTFTGKLPAGSYILQTRPRGFGSGGISEASVTLYRSAKQPVQLMLQFVPVSAIPVEVELDDEVVTAATAAGQAITPPERPHACSCAGTHRATAVHRR